MPLKIREVYQPHSNKHVLKFLNRPRHPATTYQGRHNSDWMSKETSNRPSHPAPWKTLAGNHDTPAEMYV